MFRDKTKSSINVLGGSDGLKYYPPGPQEEKDGVDLRSDRIYSDSEVLIQSDGKTAYRFNRGNVLEDLDWVNDNVISFHSVTQRMVELYSRKNRDYGNSFDSSLDEDGLLVAKIRLGDKIARFSQQIKAIDGNYNMAVEDESVLDTLIDLANYAAMTVRYLEEKYEEDSDNE